MMHRYPWAHKHIYLCLSRRLWHMLLLPRDTCSFLNHTSHGTAFLHGPADALLWLTSPLVHTLTQAVAVFRPPVSQHVG